MGPDAAAQEKELIGMKLSPFDIHMLSSVLVNEHMVPTHTLMEDEFLSAAGLTHGLLLISGEKIYRERLDADPGRAIRGYWFLDKEMCRLKTYAHFEKGSELPTLSDVGRRYYQALYYRIIAHAFASGVEVPTLVSQQACVQMAYRRLTSRQKAAITATSIKGASQELLNSHGVLIKRQDGRQTPGNQVRQIADLFDWIFGIFGDLSGLLNKTGTLVIHTNGKHPYGFPTAAGLFSPDVANKVIHLGYAGVPDRRVLLHELIGHWLDHVCCIDQPNCSEAYLSETKSERQWLTRARKLMTPSRTRRHRDVVEVWARMVEQYIWDKQEHAYDCNYYEKPGYWQMEKFAPYQEQVRQGIVVRLNSIGIASEII